MGINKNVLSRVYDGAARDEAHDLDQGNNPHPQTVDVSASARRSASRRLDRRDDASPGKDPPPGDSALQPLCLGVCY